ncbi:Hint domain-containing protein [Acetobacter oryzifermentans]|uniref:Hint domain-containing protein n=1 Tax=Acetobacter oryzifermentans TaxID=1633874 RepID=UPI003463BF1E
MANTTDTWTGAAGNSNWNDANNWDNGVPTASSDVVINSGVIGDSLSNTLPSGGSSTIASLTINGDGDVSLNGSRNAQYRRTNLIVNGDVTVPPDAVTTVNGTYLISSGNISGGTILIAQGTTLQGNVSTPISFSPTNDGVYANSLYLTGLDAPSSVLNFSSYDSITFGSLVSDESTQHSVYIKDNPDSTGSLFEVYDETADKVLIPTLTMAPGADVTKITWQSDAGTLNCFLPGSMIRTCDGDVAVENIQIGDEVITFDWKNNKNIVRKVVWVGKARAVVRPELHDDEAGWPVRILKGAIADGVPYKDMLITPEHCLFLKDRFVPARMLVNGVSIFYDKSITSYDYYHVETEQHSVITADGALTESYLDTGNRSSFRQEGKVITLFGSVKNWEDDACAPLGVERSFVEPLYHAIERRENSIIGAHTSTEGMELTHDPDLHLVTNTGTIVWPMRKTAHQYSFMLPSDTQSVRIVSRASRPSDVIGPFVDDRRYMGVAVTDVRLQCANQHFDITSHLQAQKPEGWHDTDWTDCAWTNGNAKLPLGNHLARGEMGILSITLRAAGPYLLPSETGSEMQKRSA